MSGVLKMVIRKLLAIFTRGSGRIGDRDRSSHRLGTLPAGSLSTSGSSCQDHRVRVRVRTRPDIESPLRTLTPLNNTTGYILSLTAAH